MTKLTFEQCLEIALTEELRKSIAKLYEQDPLVDTIRAIIKTDKHRYKNAGPLPFPPSRGTDNLS